MIQFRWHPDSDCVLFTQITKMQFEGTRTAFRLFQLECLYASLRAQFETLVQERDALALQLDEVNASNKADLDTSLELFSEEREYLSHELEMSITDAAEVSKHHQQLQKMYNEKVALVHEIERNHTKELVASKAAAEERHAEELEVWVDSHVTQHHEHTTTRVRREKE